ncbi:hypothetical protein CTI12_AA478130 [Artemisia annua]|uniref:Retrotransposon gag domain-containing protein n=1 Tax=Artemisia annua TaxID=35608 RepID=A0A2U1LKP8_ARTAN|nr:hypothetical protein CTI12_AA478130 [Artemisia annua]
MAKEQPRGRRGRRGGYARGQPRQGADRNEEEPRPNSRDQRDLEIAAQGRRIRELERLLAQARLDDFCEAYRDEESEGSDINSTESNNEEDENPWRPGRYNFPQNLGVKVDIPDFESNLHPDEFIDWLYTVERVFDIKNLSDEQKVKLVAIKLKKNASIWWEHVVRQRTREGKAKIVNWSKMKKKLMAKFLPVQYRQEAFIEYHNYKQTSISVEEFTSEFDRLRLRCDVVEEEEETIARYLAALKPEISVQQYLSYNDETKNHFSFRVALMAEIPTTVEVFALVMMESNPNEFRVPLQVGSMMS